jgi:hypothetical protein
MVACIAEHLTHHACRLADVFVDDSGGDHFEKVGLEGSGDCAGEQRLACPGRAVEKYTFWGRDADALEEFGIEEGKFDDLRCVENAVGTRVRETDRKGGRTSRSSRTCSPRPPIPAKVAPPGSSRLILYTMGSTSRGRMRMIVRVVMSRLTRVPAFSLLAGRAGR